MSRVLSVTQPAYAPASSEVLWSTSVTLKSGATRKLLLTRSTIIGPCAFGFVGVTSCATAATGAIKTKSHIVSARLRIWSNLVLSAISMGLRPRPQTDIERRRFLAPHLNICGEGLVPFFLNLNAVGAFRHFHDEAILSRRSLPRLTINQDVGAGRLNANRQRAVRRWIGRPRIPWPGRQV